MTTETTCHRMEKQNQMTRLQLLARVLTSVACLLGQEVCEVR